MLVFISHKELWVQSVLIVRSRAETLWHVSESWQKPTWVRSCWVPTYVGGWRALAHLWVEGEVRWILYRIRDCRVIEIALRIATHSDHLWPPWCPSQQELVVVADVEASRVWLLWLIEKSLIIYNWVGGRTLGWSEVFKKASPLSTWAISIGTEFQVLLLGFRRLKLVA